MTPKRTLVIERTERTEEKQGHDGRIRSREWVFWTIVDVERCEIVREYTRKREAVAELRRLTSLHE